MPMESKILNQKSKVSRKKRQDKEGGSTCIRGHKDKVRGALTGAQDPFSVLLGVPFAIMYLACFDFLQFSVERDVDHGEL
jgi:hypothetical protein